jgi:dTDP-D-glucose 4,6-dehydratase
MNIIGETQDSEKYMAMIMKKIYNDEKVVVHFNKGDIGSRYYLHARSLASGLMHILEQNFPKYGEADLPLRMHIAGEKKLNNLELAQLVADAAGKQLNYDLVNPNMERPGHDMHYALSGDNLAKSGWTHPMKIEESINGVVRWTFDHPEWLQSYQTIAAHSPAIVLGSDNSSAQDLLEKELSCSPFLQALVNGVQEGNSDFPKVLPKVQIQMANGFKIQRCACSI